MNTSRPAAIVIGVGNEFRGDDGSGIAVARRLGDELPDEVRVIEQSGEGTALMEAWRGATLAILIDAVQSGAAPGTIHRFDASAKAVPSGFRQCSTHAFGLAEAIELSRALLQLPARVIVYGIEGSSFAEGTALSPSVERTLPEVVSRIVEELLTAT
jgi:hydrogenase maturation protease